MAKQLRRLANGTAYATCALVGLPVALSVGKATYDYATAEPGRVSESHTAYSIWVQSLTNLLTTQMGKSSSKRLEQDCRNAAQVNEELLLKLLRHNQDTEYGKDHKFSEIQDRESFRKIHPLTTYDHYRPYIEKMKAGQEHVLVADKLKMFGVTSGTSGTKNLLPVVPNQRKVFFTEGIGVVFDAMIQSVNARGIRWPNLQKSCKLMYVPKYSETESGIRVGPNASAPHDNPTLQHLYSTSPDAWQVTNAEHVLFLHVLYALLDRNLGLIESNFASGVFHFFELLDQQWDEFMTAIESGKLPPWLEMEDAVRQQLESKLRLRPDRAAELRLIRNSPQYSAEPSLARQIWPYLHTIMANETGSFQIYGSNLKKQWLGNEIPIYSPIYAATEGLIAVNQIVGGHTFTLQPHAMFFEFIPMGGDNSQEETATLFIEQLQEGQYYEMIITNLCGLCRYRFGDVVHCVGYQGETPLLKVAYRKGQFLNALQENTSEQAFYQALRDTVERDWKMKLVDYTTVEHFFRKKDRRPRYTVYVELEKEGEGVVGQLSSKQVQAVDKELGKSNPAYGWFRSAGRMQEMDVIVVKPGTFQSMRRKMVTELGVNPSQLKQPRVTRNEQLVNFLEKETAKIA